MTITIMSQLRMNAGWDHLGIQCYSIWLWVWMCICFARNLSQHWYRLPTSFVNINGLSQHWLTLHFHQIHLILLNKTWSRCIVLRSHAPDILVSSHYCVISLHLQQILDIFWNVDEYWNKGMIWLWFGDSLPNWIFGRESLLYSVHNAAQRSTSNHSIQFRR